MNSSFLFLQTRLRCTQYGCAGFLKAGNDSTCLHEASGNSLEVFSSELSCQCHLKPCTASIDIPYLLQYFKWLLMA